MAKGVIAAAGGAVVTSLATIACCLPASMLAAAGLAGVASVLAGGHLWLTGLSLVFLGVGGAQAWRAKRCGAKPSPVAIGLLTLAVGVVLLVTLFPQVVAGFLADTMEWSQP